MAEKPVRLVQVENYLVEHNILRILNDLTSMLVFYRPDNPRKFLVEELRKMKEEGVESINVPRLLDAENASAMFDTLDTTKRGYITEDQYTKTLRQIGIQQFKMYPEPDCNSITREIFMKQFEARQSSSSASSKDAVTIPEDEDADEDDGQKTESEGSETSDDEGQGGKG